MFQTRYRYVYILLLSVYSFANLKFTEGDAVVAIDDLALAAYLTAFVFLIWEGNRFIAAFSHRKLENSEYGPLILHFGLSVLLIFGLSFIGSFLANYWTHATESYFKQIVGFNFRINLFLHCINAIIYFRKRVSDFEVQTERFKMQSAEAQFDALRKQINPHFLFNSFNVLSTLVYQDADKASKFIDQLSQVYRYLLKNQDNKLVPLSEELRFLEAYIYLIKIRFQDNLIIENDVSARSAEKYIAPSALQLLIENAIKHNEVSKKSPLHVKISAHNGHIIVENNIQLKEQREESSYVGLNNIRNRYAFLSEKNPVIVHANGKFTVKIPLIEVEES